MSEDFDKEAERERLREKYEADREDREATERMSELLLQGATMTNQHCDTCGSPIFRYQDQAFCPTCQQERGEAQADSGESARTGGKGSPTGGQESSAGVQNQAGRGDAATGTEAEGGAPGSVASPGTTEASQTAGTAAGGPDHARAPTGQTPEGAVGGAGQSAPAGSLDEARQSLVQTITSLTRRAAATKDPRQAKELLAAAREAAETLATLQGSR